MSASEGSLGSAGAGGSAPPPAPTPAAPSTPAAPPPAAAPAAAEPAAPPSDVAAAPGTQIGATPSPSEKPRTLDEARAKFHRNLQGERAGEGTQPGRTPAQTPLPEKVVAPPPAKEAAPPTPKPATPKEEVGPAREAATEAEPAVEAPPPIPVDVATLDDGEDLDADSDLETLLNADELEKRFPRQISKKVKAAIAARETERGELRQHFNSIGGKTGLEMAQVINPIVWKNNPTEQDVDTVLDYLTLPEHAGADKLVGMMGQRLVNMQLQDETTGREFASQIISEEWGDRPDGKPYDLETINKLVEGHKRGMIDLNYLDAELAASPAPEPTARELELEQQLNDLKGVQQSKAEEVKRTHEKDMAIYRTQAKGFVSNFLMKPVLPLATKSGWAPGEKDEGDVLEEKQTLGEIVADHINRKLETSPEYADVMAMIENKTAFDLTGKPTPRFLVKLDPLQNRALAQFNRLQRQLGKRFRYSAEHSHNAKLVEKNGVKKAAATTDQQEPPPVAPPPRDNEKRERETTEEALNRARSKFKTAREAERREQSVGVLR